MDYHTYWTSYWNKRKNFKYYQLVKKWLGELGEQDSILDVGYGGTLVATYGNFKKRYAINKDACIDINGVECFTTDWLSWEIKNKFSVITCLQVLEHLQDNEIINFSNKIFDNSEKSIVSVPYKWPDGKCNTHLQDPIDICKFINMVGKDPKKVEIIDDEHAERIVALFVNEKNPRRRRGFLLL